ncbi:signal peptidase I [Treponema endosymbiont of Eucomonympha sp.]|uniref:signal peptidase I n=1 Tax=Treponema endosymbiont of Eucomonympha sp. TaxID=1580831 RepID=UPI0007812FB8|nr:signal peptidase I [Treponema endosymbiont of Eucomonympha sp.]
MAKKAQYMFTYHRKKERRRWAALLAAAIVCGLLCVTLFPRFVAYPVAVRSGSMAPAVSSGSSVFVAPLSARKNGKAKLLRLKRGDVVLAVPFERPRAPLIVRAADRVAAFVTLKKVSLIPPENRPSLTLVRAVGMPGDTVYLKDYALYVKSAGASDFRSEAELTRRGRYTIVTPSLPKGWDLSLGASGALPERTLGDDEYFLLCDNRATAVDSRIWGPVSADKIVARAVLRYLPLPLSFL